jgi:hypothetical protein
VFPAGSAVNVDSAELADVVRRLRRALFLALA